jgi:hypothetical protein
MSRRRLFPLGLMLALASLPVAHAAVPLLAQAEISYLLEYVGTSGCEFYRNGAWYDSQHAQAHLRAKYELLSTNGDIKTAEDFIAKAASKSSLSGQPYQIRCGSVGAATVSTDQWLHEALALYRHIGAYSTPCASVACRERKESLHSTP